MATVGLLGGCTGVNRAALVASTLALACDAAQTYRAADSGWMERYEENPILGRKPTTPTVLAYFTTAIVGNAVVWAVMPRSVKSLVPTGIIAFQANSISMNMESTSSVCGIPTR